MLVDVKEPTAFTKEVKMAKNSRPLSPHLEIYKLEITMLMSGVHRISGVVLYMGFGLLTLWLTLAAIGGGSFETMNLLSSHWFGQLVIFGFTWALLQHMVGGLRHFVWDLGHGFSDKARYGLAWMSLFGGLTLTILTWAIVLWR